jgi:uridine kinase
METFARALRRFLLDPGFVLGLLLRALLISVLVPAAVSAWYLPFLEHAAEGLSVDPWKEFLSQGGSPLAFPYGYAMWMVFFPFVKLCQIAGIESRWGYGIALVLIDFCLMRILQKYSGLSLKKLVRYYWLSPIVLIATYWLGLNDIVPVALLCGALLAIKNHRMMLAGVLSGFAISAKLSMVLSVPIFLLYLLCNRGLRKMVWGYVSGLAGVLVVLGVPFIFSKYGMSMLFGNPEMAKALDFKFEIGAGRSLYVLPFAYLLMLYGIWRIGRVSYTLFFTLLGLAFFLVLLFSPAAPGWYVWVVPLLVFYQSQGNWRFSALVWCFGAIYAFNNIVFPVWPAIQATSDQSLFSGFEYFSVSKVSGLAGTVLLAFGVVIALRIWRGGVARNDYYRLSRKPFVLGIAGDSGAGKDTLTDAIAGIIGEHSVVRVSGDDYHNWDRHKPMWQVLTHLNPKANDLERFAKDVIALSDGKEVMARHYDHSTGKMSKMHRVKSNDFVIASGLHALYQPLLRDSYDLSIYLDIDESLRRFFKIERDVHQRGHALEKVLQSMAKRESDARLFIHPQRETADIVLSLQPIHPSILEPSKRKGPLRFKLFVRAPYGLYETSLERALVGVCGLHVDTSISVDNAFVEMTIEGETSAEDVEFASRIVMPEIGEFIDRAPQWKDGIPGLMQLIVLTHMTQALRKRLV